MSSTDTPPATVQADLLGLSEIECNTLAEALNLVARNHTQTILASMQLSGLYSKVVQAAQCFK